MAKVGDILSTPEESWKRIFADEKGFRYSGDYQKHSRTYFADVGNKKMTCKFKFSGTKLRFITSVSGDRSNDLVCKIDGVNYPFSQQYNTLTANVLCFSVENLEDKVHEVEVITGTPGSYCGLIMDRIDIDSNGYIIVQIGDQLLQPEPGWRRYDDTYQGLIYSNSWNRNQGGGYASAYNGGYSYSTAIDSTMRFKFYGSKLRIIASYNSNLSNDILVIIDGIEYHFSEYATYMEFQILVFEKLNLDKKIHEVVIRTLNTSYSIIDAIDIDEDGHICEDNCQLYHGAKYLLKDNSTNELYTLSESNEVVKLDTNVIHSQQFITNGFETITLLNNHTSVLNSNYSILAYTEESTFKEATATFNHEPKSLLNENYDLLMLSDTDGTLKLNAIPQDQIVKGNGDIDLSGIKRLDKIELVSNNIKAALSFDSGVTWNTLVDGIWQSIDITNISEFNSKGMTNTLLAEVPGVKLEELRGESDKLRLAYLLSQEELNNPAYTDSLSLKVTLSGKDTIAANSEWSYVLLDDLQILEYTFNQNGTYTINYAY